MKDIKIGYTQGTFDMFHIGHLNLLKNAKEKCDYLIVGVNSDDLVLSYKNKMPIISVEDRVEIISSIKYVDKVVITNTLDKVESYEKYHYSILFIGDDWRNSERWMTTEKIMNEMNVEVNYLPYTKRVSSTQIRMKIGL